VKIHAVTVRTATLFYAALPEGSVDTRLGLGGRWEALGALTVRQLERVRDLADRGDDVTVLCEAERALRCAREGLDYAEELRRRVRAQRARFDATRLARRGLSAPLDGSRVRPLAVSEVAS
jgi:hypothetical protein